MTAFQRLAAWWRGPDYEATVDEIADHDQVRDIEHVRHCHNAGAVVLALGAAEAVPEPHEQLFTLHFSASDLLLLLGPLSTS